MTWVLLQATQRSVYFFELPRGVGIAILKLFERLLDTWRVLQRVVHSELVLVIRILREVSEIVGLAALNGC